MATREVADSELTAIVGGGVGRLRLGSASIREGLPTGRVGRQRWAAHDGALGESTGMETCRGVEGSPAIVDDVEKGNSDGWSSEEKLDGRGARRRWRIGDPIEREGRCARPAIASGEGKA